MGNTHFYGFSKYEYQGKLVHVICFSEESCSACRQLGLLSAEEFCNGDLFCTFLPVELYHQNYLGPGVANFQLYLLPYDWVNWMSRLRDDTLLVDVALPGSHKAGSTQSADSGTMWVRTQKFSIILQLILGIRVFDIRPARAGQGVGREDDGIWTHHSGCKGEKLRRILNCTRIFLEAYPSETVIFVLSDYKNVSEREVYEAIRNAAGSFLVNHNGAVNELTVGKTRGKLIVLDDGLTVRHQGPNGHDGTNSWEEMLQHLNKIQPISKSFNRFVTALTARNRTSAVKQTPEYLAVHGGMLGLLQWLRSRDADKIGIVEANWFGNCGEISTLVKHIVEKNITKGNMK
jgi:hypothetical protein